MSSFPIVESSSNSNSNIRVQTQLEVTQLPASRVTLLSPAAAARSFTGDAIDTSATDFIRPFHLRVKKFFVQKQRVLNRFITTGTNKEIYKKSMLFAEYSSRAVSAASVVALTIPMMKQAAGVLVVLTGVFFVARSISGTMNVNKSFKRISSMKVSEGYMQNIKDLTIQTHKHFGGSNSAAIVKRTIDIAIDAGLLVVGLLGVIGVVSSTGGGIAAGVVAPISLGAIGAYLIYSYKDRPLRLLEKLKLRDVHLIQQKACLQYLKAREWVMKKIDIKDSSGDMKLGKEKIRKEIKSIKNKISKANQADLANYIVRKGGDSNLIINGKKSKLRGYYPDKYNTFEPQLITWSENITTALLDGEMLKKDKIFLLIGMGIDVDRIHESVKVIVDDKKLNKKERAFLLEIGIDVDKIDVDKNSIEVVLKQCLLQALHHYYGQGKADLKNLSMEVNDSGEVQIAEQIKSFLKDKYIPLNKKKSFLESMKAFSPHLDLQRKKEMKAFLAEVENTLNERGVFQLEANHKVIIMDFMHQIGLKKENDEVQILLNNLEKIIK